MKKSLHLLQNQKLTDSQIGIIELMAIPKVDDIDFDTLNLCDEVFQPADLS
jgi:hypothetical protein